jgi:uncharacterized phosphosugar-binding protein
LNVIGSNVYFGDLAVVVGILIMLAVFGETVTLEVDNALPNVFYTEFFPDL